MPARIRSQQVPSCRPQGQVAAGRMPGQQRRLIGDDTRTRRLEAGNRMAGEVAGDGTTLVYRCKRRLDIGAHLLRERAPRTEATAGRRRHLARDVAAQDKAVVNAFVHVGDRGD